MSSLWQQLLQVTDSQQCQLLGHRAPGLLLGVTSALWVFRAWLGGCQGWQTALPRAGPLLCPGLAPCSAQGSPLLCPQQPLVPCPGGSGWALLCVPGPAVPGQSLFPPEARGLCSGHCPACSATLQLLSALGLQLLFPSLQLQVLHWPHQPKALLFPHPCQEVTRGMPGMPSKSGYEQPEVR